MEYVVGQRWVSQAEPQLGLGIIVSTDSRQVTVHYPAIEEDRIYASNNSPLARISYQPGDEVQDSQQNRYTVKAVEELKGLNYYLVDDLDGNEQILTEASLASSIQLSSPVDRLFSGQFDRNRLYRLRTATLHYHAQQQQSDCRGLFGPRTSLLGHQLYIAHEVATRFAPRVLLADEVGLGKTIEAGMILHHQLQSGLASRVLIVVPEPLLHQWLVEMLRKFNLHFSLFDRERYTDLQEGGNENPFETEQLVLCGLDFLTSDANIAGKAEQGEWDLVIVDEAHHLEWDGDDESTSNSETTNSAYRCIEALAKRCQGMLLLTATPEQLGVASHFARLRLLDPSRFNDLDSFIEEQKHFVELGDIVRKIDSGDALSGDERAQLQQLVGEQLPELDALAIKGENSKAERAALVDQLLDRHGTGRILFRNTRSAIENFPVRVPTPHKLPHPENFSADSIWPELAEPDWLALDPRVGWLENLLGELRKEKVLLICANMQTAIDLEHHLHLNKGVRSTAFYEKLSIVERDRAAAYFADPDGGAQVMICSEIGSEGRNFQFAHHLILFDLPTNPDLLEQRIGRLDRIGQTEDIKIHIPYIENSPQERLYQWYDQGLDAFRQNFSAGLATYNQFEQRLEPWLFPKRDAQPPATEQFTQILAETSEHVAALREELERGRDHLLELNSYDRETGRTIVDTIEQAEANDALPDYAAMLFDTLGVEQEYHSERSYVIRPTEQMLLSEFPYLSDEGATITFSRDIALQREDMEFCSWEHPMIAESMDTLLASEMGNCAIGTLKLKALPAGTVLLECFYSIQASAPKKLQLHRFLPATPVRLLLESGGKDLTNVIKHQQLNQLQEHLKRSARFAIVKRARPTLESMLAKAQASADQQCSEAVQKAGSEANAKIRAEIDRLRQLQALNGSVRDQEIEYYEEQLRETIAALETATANIQTLRVVINT